MEAEGHEEAVAEDRWARAACDVGSEELHLAGAEGVVVGADFVEEALVFFVLAVAIAVAARAGLQGDYGEGWPGEEGGAFSPGAVEPVLGGDDVALAGEAPGADAVEE